MKKILFVALLALTCSFTACDGKQVITFDQIPESAQNIVATHFDVAQLAYVTLDKELWNKEYELRFNHGCTIEFDKHGELVKVDCKAAEVPSALVPEPVQAYVKAQFPNAFITEWGKDDRGYKAELNNGLDLEFNRKYEFVRIDD